MVLVLVGENEPKNTSMKRDFIPFHLFSLYLDIYPRWTSHLSICAYVHIRFAFSPRNSEINGRVKVGLSLLLQFFFFFFLVRVYVASGWK